VTAEGPQSSKAFGLMSDFVKLSGKKQPDRN
jgi:hypothetical protein